MINTKHLFESKIKHPYVALIVLILITFLMAYGRYIWGGEIIIFIQMQDQIVQISIIQHIFI